MMCLADLTRHVIGCFVNKKWSVPNACGQRGERYLPGPAATAASSGSSAEAPTGMGAPNTTVCWLAKGYHVNPRPQKMISGIFSTRSSQSRT